VRDNSHRHEYTPAHSGVVVVAAALLSFLLSTKSCHNVCLIVYYVYATFDALWVSPAPMVALLLCFVACTSIF